MHKKFTFFKKRPISVAKFSTSGSKTAILGEKRQFST